MREKMDRDDFRILIASTEKTGNTWLKLLLSHIYELPTPYLGPDFSEAEANALGPHWVTHQHFLPEARLLDWATATRTRLLTTLRHPGDLLVSLYHYCFNYPEHYKDDRRIARAIAADAEEHRAAQNSSHYIVDGELIRALQDRVMCDLNISISWIHSRRSIVVRYEDLRIDPFSTLRRVCDCIAPASEDRIVQAVERCELNVLRDKHQEDSRFFRRALLGEGRSVLPAHVLRRFRDEEPFQSQFAFLSYDPEFDTSVEKLPRAQRGESGDPRCHAQCFDNGVPFVPVLKQLLETIDPQKRQCWGPILETSSPESFFQWLNAAADHDVLAPIGVPCITNLATCIHRIRPDLQAAFPDPFNSNRLGYASWFLRYAAYAYQLDLCFLTPIALSWLSPPREIHSEFEQPHVVGLA